MEILNIGMRDIQRKKDKDLNGCRHMNDWK